MWQRCNLRFTHIKDRACLQRYLLMHMHRASLRLVMGASLLCGATAFPAAATGSLGSRILLGPPRSPSHRAIMMTTGRAAEDGDAVQKGSTDRSHAIVFKEKKITANNGEVCPAHSTSSIRFDLLPLTMSACCSLQTLRTALLRTGLTPHNGRAQLINCRGLGTCGTCAVEIKGAVSPTCWNAKESLRLNFPPHGSPGNQKLRLACQVCATSR